MPAKTRSLIGSSGLVVFSAIPKEASLCVYPGGFLSPELPLSSAILNGAFACSANIAFHGAQMLRIPCDLGISHDLCPISYSIEKHKNIAFCTHVSTQGTFIRGKRTNL
ncbi:hypothetical protein L873DRAFT_1120237 [Choiromyces venosus 120613-1]|uniref:Uncharacterized protein n=1 Tax=Choiromyces venosus 120613-1 TaxID=1336337 RepID=A0A3N4JGW2_9PEZI|nr:hypothetical protein L873DRAFT_1120237 [Choiromyces venosus 120613-1]